MKQTVDIYFTVARILALIFGILYCITIVGAIFGIPMIIASNKFKNASIMSDEDLVKNRGSILGWGIFLSIMFAPTFFGLVALICMAMLVDNYIRNIEQGEYAKNEKDLVEVIEDGANSAWNDVKSTFSNNSDIDKQKADLKKLQKMKDEGLITREEYEAMRRKILGL